MVGPKFIVFIAGRGNEGCIVSRIEKRGYSAMVDSINGGSKNFLKQIVAPWRGYYFEDDTLVAEKISDDLIEPFDIIIVLDKEYTPEEMNLIDSWVHNFINPYAKNTGNADSEKAEEFMKKPLKLKTTEVDAQLLARHLPTWYDLKMLETKKGMLYEVTKPHTDTPYVTLNSNFEKNGHLDFFTNLFICTSWGVCSDDIAFLKECWMRLGMHGTFNMDDLLKKRVHRCSQGESEPRVWRSYIANVAKIIDDSYPKRRIMSVSETVKKYTNNVC